MRIVENVTIGDQFGSIEVDDSHMVSINMTNLKGRMSLQQLEGLMKASRDLDRRVSPPAPAAKKRRRK